MSTNLNNLWHEAATSKVVSQVDAGAKVKLNGDVKGVIKESLGDGACSQILTPAKVFKRRRDQLWNNSELLPAILREWEQAV